MINRKKIVIYSTIFAFVFNILFFNIGLAANDLPKALEDIEWSCIMYWKWYKFEKNKGCVCENPAKNGWCDSGLRVDKNWCCIGSCGVCSSNSVEFQKYINFQTELFGLLLNELGFDKKEESRNNFTKRWLFSHNVLSIPSKIRNYLTARFKRVGQEYVDTWNAIKMGSLVVTSIITEWRKDMIAWISILFKSEPIVRERGTVESLDLVVYDLMQDFGEKWLWNKEISDTTRIKIEQISKNYIKTNQNQRWMFEKFYFQWEVKYKDVINASKKINSLMKNFLLTWKGGNLFMRSFEKEFSKWNIIIKFSENRTKNILDDYMCARKINACDKYDFKDFSKLGGLQSSFSESMNIIKKANQDLAEVFTDIKDRKNEKSNPYWLTDKQIELLRTVYGINTSKITQEQGVWLKTLFSKDWKARTNIKNGIDLWFSDVFTNKEKTINENIKKGEKKEEQDKEYIQTLSPEDQERIKKILESEATKTSDMKSALLNTLDSVLSEKNQHKDIVLFYSTNSTNLYFTETLKLIQNIIEESIGKKDTKWLVKYLWEACTYQCANKWTKNCFK